MYRDPYSDFGRLAQELWRAARLVVDTGLHDKKWTREEAIDYLKQNTPNSEADCIDSINRYIVTPGQATAYKIGMIKILELREKAKEQLGSKFDIRQFHDVVLKNGAVPLDVLEELVNRWIKSKKAGESVQRSHGLFSNTEWTGVLLKTVLEEAGIKRKARWIVAEGADASRMSRSIPLEKALDDVLVAYGQNGEALRPEQGYPLRLVVPGWEGNINIKWLGRIMVTDEPFMTREEAAVYTDLMPDGKARWFTFVMEAKSVITRPSGEQLLDAPGFYEISGLAWSGRGRITRVEVSTDDGKTWTDAQLNSPVFPKAATRFSLAWKWDGGEAALQSRCTDETGYVQPTREQLISVRGLHPGPDGFNHYNGIKTWFVHRDGKVSHV